MPAIEQTLDQRLSLALRIAARTIRFLGEDGFSAADTPENNFAAEKPLSETAMLLHVANRCTQDPAVRKQLDDLIDDLIPRARSHQREWDVLRNRSVCFQLATPHILLNVLGHPNSHFDDVLAQAEAAGASRGHEVVPYRELEIIWLRSVWRNEIPGLEFEEIARRTALANPIDLLNGSRDDAYAHTHAVMYYTGFGQWRKPLPRPAEDFLGESATVLARALISEDYDLAAEALIAWPLLSSTWSPAAAFGFRVVASLEDEVGFLPAGRLAAANIEKLSGDEKTKHALASSYHTAFVMGILCALSLKPGMAAPNEIKGTRFKPALAKHLSTFIASTGAHWETVFHGLNPDEQASLVPFLLDVALIQSSRKNEFAQTASLLQLAAQNQLADTTLCAQAAELLSGIASFSGFNSAS